MGNELMKARYKVIADYPQSVFSINEILEVNGDCAGIGKYNSGILIRSVYKPDKYPHLFKKLEWWEDRTIEQLQSLKFAKIIKYRGYWLVNDIVHVLNLVLDPGNPIGYMLEYKHWQPVFELEPATKEDYVKFKTRKV